MLSQLLSLLVASKGGALAAATIVAGATTVGVMTSSPELQDAVAQITSPGMSQLAKAGNIHGECEGGQPPVVAQRNAADKLLRDAYQDEHKRLADLRGGGKDVDHKAVNEVVRAAERELRGVLTTALNEVARETLGREGLVRLNSPTPTPATGTENGTTETPPSGPCPPKPSHSPKPEGERVGGRAGVAGRVTLSATLQEIVDKAKEDMKALVDGAQADVELLPSTQQSAGKGKPESQPGRAEERQNADRGRPAEPPGKPNSVPRKP